MNEDPFPNVAGPMTARAMEVLIDLGDEIGLLHGLGRIALEHRPRANAPTVAFQVAIGTIGPDLLEISAEGMAGRTDEPILKCGALLGMER
jgi:hypothetical protein